MAGPFPFDGNENGRLHLTPTLFPFHLYDSIRRLSFQQKPSISCFSANSLLKPICHHGTPLGGNNNDLESKCEGTRSLSTEGGEEEERVVAEVALFEVCIYLETNRTETPWRIGL